MVTVPLGNAIGIAGLAITTSAFRKVLRRKVTTNDQRTWLRRRLIIYNSCWLGAGLLCGTTSAAFHLAWIDIGAAIYAALVAAGWLVVLRRLANS